MALWAIGDLHLSGQTNKQMDKFGELWNNHPQKIKENWERLVKPEDTIVITGDVSWGNRFADSQDDLNFIKQLPGRKIILRGNHCRYWGDVKDTKKLNEMFKGSLSFLQNNYFTYGDYALIGTKGYCVEYDDITEELAKKRFEREERRMRISYEKAKEDGYKKFIMFLHYPPTNKNEKTGVFTELAKEMQVEQVVYSHLHGYKYNQSVKGVQDGIKYTLVSADYVNFVPQLILV